MARDVSRITGNGLYCLMQMPIPWLIVVKSLLHPFSYVLRREEREWLDLAAAGMPLGAFLRSLIFDEALLSKRRKSSKVPVKDHQVLARLQALKKCKGII